MSGSADFFIRTKAPEEKILSILNKYIALGVESIELPDDTAALFLQYLEYSEGFALNAGLAWGLDELELNEVQIACALAKELSTDVLFQPQKLALPEDMEWCLVKPEGNIYAVHIIELDDGIDVHPNTSIRLIASECTDD
jgi:hypothetical protein